MEDYNMQGNEIFSDNGNDLTFSVLDFWRYAYGDLNSDPRDEVAEFLVSMALGLPNSINRQEWKSYDIEYCKKRIEVKSTSYFQTWRTDGKVCDKKVFSIRQMKNNDCYVFCVLQGKTRETSVPIKVENWDFYVVPTKVLFEQYPGHKTIPLQKIQELGFSPLKYSELKQKIDGLIDAM